MTTSKWQIDRGQLNHNWLQNVVLVGLGHSFEVCAGGVKPYSVRRALLMDVLPWHTRRAELHQLLRRFENEMTPKMFFDLPPLSRCSVATKEWLVPVTHQLWLAREKVPEKISSALSAYVATEHAYNPLCAAVEALPEDSTVESLEPIELLLKTFAKACESLARSISALPRSISYIQP